MLIVDPSWKLKQKNELIIKQQQVTMYIQNRRNSSKFNGCSPLQNRNGLISLKPAIAYFAYTHRYVPQKDEIWEGY